MMIRRELITSHCFRVFKKLLFEKCQEEDQDHQPAAKENMLRAFIRRRSSEPINDFKTRKRAKVAKIFYLKTSKSLKHIAEVPDA